MSTSKPSPGCAIVLLAIGVLVALVGLGQITDGGVGGIVAGVIIGAIGYAWWKSLKPTYYVNLGSASGESRAMHSHNKEEIDQIVAAIKRAIIERG